MANNRCTSISQMQIDHNVQKRSDLTLISHDMHLDVLSPHLDSATDVRLLISCGHFASRYQSDISYCTLLQFMIDDDREKVKQILDKHPTLLLHVPNEKFIVSSRYTWQKFFAEPALTMAMKRKQIEMIKLILPYYDKLPQTDEIQAAKRKALSAWADYADIVIPHEYEIYLQSLVDVFAEETFPHGKKINARLSDKTEAALRLFRRIMLPHGAVKLDDYFEPEIFLYAAYKIYIKNANKLQNSGREHFCVKVIGFIQSLLTPETAKILCEGLYFVVEEKRSISDQGKSLKLHGGEAFYRSSRVSRSGLGFDYCCGAGGLTCLDWGYEPGTLYWQKYIEQKQQVFGRLCNDHQQNQYSILKQQRCVIL